MITAFGNLETAVTAVQNGAFDYLAKPFDLEQAATVIGPALAVARVQAGAAIAELATGVAGDELLGSGPAMQEVFKRIALVAGSDCSVLITGESGTGKELVARAIHRHSSRADRPFVPINLASLSPTLVESELFGHVKGAFTGADAARQGLLELADGATVFFDEAADIPPNVQVKLLRVLEQHEVTPVGDTQPRPSAFRAIAATNRDLRRDFTERQLPPGFVFSPGRVRNPSAAAARSRLEDIPLLGRAISGALVRPASRPCRFTPAAIAELCRRPGPATSASCATPSSTAPRWPGRGDRPGASAAAAGTRIERSRPHRAARWSKPCATGPRPNWPPAAAAAACISNFWPQAEPPLFETVLDSTCKTAPPPPTCWAFIGRRCGRNSIDSRGNKNHRDAEAQRGQTGEREKRVEGREGKNRPQRRNDAKLRRQRSTESDQKIMEKATAAQIE